MPQALSMEGTVVAVAADRGHHFSKPPQDRIVLVEGHGPYVRHRYLARRQPRLANLRQDCHSACNIPCRNTTSGKPGAVQWGLPASTRVSFDLFDKACASGISSPDNLLQSHGIPARH